jgi:CelD/BcsL family acetyltransferase involved in cellulose biosynthesis
MQGQEVTISLYEGAVPEFAAGELERLYRNPYCTLLHHALHGALDGSTGTYVARRNGVTTAVLLYRREGDTLRVLNEQLRIDGEEMDCFARHVFAACFDLKVIIFHAVAIAGGGISLPYQHFRCTEDIVLELPADVDAYRSRLGKSTRSYLSRYLNRLRRAFPDMEHQVVDGSEVGEEDLLAIIRMNAARMQGKQHDSYIDEAEARRILTMVRRHGLVSLLRLNGELCAGAINLRYGGNYFLKVIAHDPAYDSYRLGTLCCFLTICACIERGGEEYHFLWGRYEYKYRLAGVQRDLEHVALYRSRRTLLRNGGMAMRNAMIGCRLQARGWMLAKAREQGAMGSALRFTAQALRKLRNAEASEAPDSP